MNNYAIEILQTALNNELIYHSQAQSFLNGASHGAKIEYFDSTIDAFRCSMDKADERIPQLTEAI